MNSTWGDETRYFFALTPDKVLECMERLGFETTGLCVAHNSFENRVYEIEIEAERRYRQVVKFYRPGRWSKDQILDEHRFLLDLQEHEIPVVAPLVDAQGQTLHLDPQTQLWYTIFPKSRGRAPQELALDDFSQLGRLLGRIHQVGKSRPAPHRLALSVDTYGRSNLDYLTEHAWIPSRVRENYVAVARAIFERIEPGLTKAAGHRIHGDCHLGNLLVDPPKFFFLDFDDMLNGPAVQDFWLLLPSPDEVRSPELDALLDGYETMTAFDYATLRLIPGLRALRMIHFSGWIARRFEDPAFSRTFSFVKDEKYWEDQFQELRGIEATLAARENPMGY